jgi:hypothetical protein
MLNNYEKVVFVTTDEIASSPDLVDEAKSGGFTMVNIPSNLKDKIQGQTDVGGNVIREFGQFKIERNENFVFKFVQFNELNEVEKQNYNLVLKVFDLIGGKPTNIQKVMVSETMQRDDYNFRPSEGLHQSSEQRIILKRSILSDKKRFIAVLLHELAHAKSGATDATRAFEDELTNMLGEVGLKAITINGEVKKSLISKIFG